MSRDRTHDSMPWRNQLSEVRKMKSAMDELRQSGQTSDETSSLEMKFPEDIIHILLNIFTFAVFFCVFA
jgi:hypothetical protein